MKKLFDVLLQNVEHTLGTAAAYQVLTMIVADDPQQYAPEEQTALVMEHNRLKERLKEEESEMVREYNRLQDLEATRAIKGK